MPKVSKAFFLVGALCGLTGMVWGSYMGATGNHSLSPAHAHLNLLGWVGMSIMGAFYALRGRGGRVAWINFGLSAGGAILMAPMLAYMLADPAARAATVGPLMPIPEVLIIGGMLVFIYAVATTGSRKDVSAPSLQQAA